MPTIGTRANAAALGYGFTGAALAAEVLGGMVLMTPTSITSTGTGNSSSIEANGSVTFSSCATLQLNGVFIDPYDNYMIAIRSVGTNSNDSLNIRFASNGTVTTDNNYTNQYVSALSTTIGASQFLLQSAARIGNTDNEHRGGDIAYIFGPRLSQPTAIRNAQVYGEAGAGIVDFVSTHTTISSYDGFWLQSGAGTFTGLISVYGFGG